MEIQEYVDRLKRGAFAPQTLTGLCGRLIRGKQPGDFQTLTDDPSRKLVMLMGPDGLQSILGKSGYDMLIEIGYEKTYIQRKLDEGCQFKLVVFKEGTAKLATWDNVIDMVAQTYPDAARTLYTRLPELKTTRFDTIEQQAGFDFSEVDKSGPTDPRYMTYERFKQSSGSLVDVRAFLYFTVHLRELYSGNGYTYTDDGKRGMMEYIVPNLPITDLGEHQLVDITITVPNGTKKGLSMATQTLPLPDFYKPANAREASYRANVNGIMPLAEEWRKRYGLKPVGGDKEKVGVLAIDAQVDFSFPSGALYVAGRSGTGAMDANQRLAEFIYANLGIISQITCTLDSHLPFQIFFPSAHIKRDGSHPTANTVILAEEYARGDYRVNPAMAAQLGIDPVWLQKQFTYTCQELEKTGKYALYLWPYHCMIGSDGNRLAGVIEEARLFHSFARGADNLPEIKGGNPLTECYSVFSPEVTTTFDGRPIPGAQKNTYLMKKLSQLSRLYIGGLASSHCVKESIADFLKFLLSVDRALLEKIYILEDCTAPVVIPNGPDFTDDAQKALDEFRNAGMHVVKSTDPIVL